jgi:hypothetical protein
MARLARRIEARAPRGHLGHPEWGVAARGMSGILPV